MKLRSSFPLTFGLLFLTTILLLMSNSVFALEEDKKVTVAPGGLTVGGPGIFEGDDGDAKTALTLPDPRTLCVTLGGRKGTTRAYFDLAPDFAVTKDVTMSVCQEAVSAVEVRCEGGKCESSWRVDAIGADGEDGADGAQGPAGPQGPPGPQGVAGAAGPAGSPGVQGPQGLQGPAGPAGPQGDAAKWHASAGVPSGNLGEIGDFYLDTDNGDVYEKTAAATWTQQDNLTGPQGLQGDPGVAGPAGPTGQTGPAGPQGAQGPQGPAGSNNIGFLNVIFKSAGTPDDSTDRKSVTPTCSPGQRLLSCGYSITDVVDVGSINVTGVAPFPNTSPPLCRIDASEDPIIAETWRLNGFALCEGGHQH